MCFCSPSHDGRGADDQSMLRMVENFSSLPEMDRSRRKVSTIPRKPSHSSPDGRAPPPPPPPPPPQQPIGQAAESLAGMMHRYEWVEPRCVRGTLASFRAGASSLKQTFELTPQRLRHLDPLKMGHCELTPRRLRIDSATPPH